MMKVPAIALGITILGFLSPLACGQDEKSPRPILQVVRLKAGESKPIELALPYGRVDFRPLKKSGRDFLFLETLPKAEGGAQTAKGKPIEHENHVFKLAPGLSVAWANDRPEIEFRAAEEAKAGTYDIKIRYASFGGGSYESGYRVIVEEAKPK